ncbi:MAG: choice-of-anchor D domain-containing protein [Granulosicoccaceae bacterium]
MFDKILAWVGNAVLASVLVILSAQQSAFAQDAVPDGGDITGKISVPLSGTATLKEVENLLISPASFDTGLTEIGFSSSAAITLIHVGAANTAAIEIGSASLFGKNASEYAVNFNGFVTLFPGDEIEMLVNFTPVTTGTKSAGMRLDIKGATSPYILLFNGWSRYPLTSDLAAGIELTKFGQVIKGKTVTKQLVLSNEGEPDAPAINISGIQKTGQQSAAFAIDFSAAQLAPGESVNVPITLNSNQVGFKSADLLVMHDGNNAALELGLEGTVVEPQNIPINFGKSTLNGVNTTRATTLQFGPDDKLYLGQMDGSIHVYNVIRNGKNNYTGNKIDTINLIKNVQNHDDDGTPNNSQNTRLLTGIHVAGTAAAPIIYAASSDPRQAAGPSGTDSNLDTNSGILHKLVKQGGNWIKYDLVLGLPRSEENHVPNGLTLYGNNKLLLNTGGHTNMGSPSNNFAQLPEYALSGAILEIDLAAIGNGPYILPTLDDEDNGDVNDPFGGNNGKNQAKLVNNGPVGLFATGYRNHYDIVVTEAGKIYTFDNGPNPGWGGLPQGNCTNDSDDGGAIYFDNLHLVTKGAYGGHPNPTRGNKSNTFNTSDPQTPIEGNAIANNCDYLVPMAGDGALTTIGSSSNGLTEYTASNFLSGMQGDLLVATFNNSIYRITLNGNGTAVTSKVKLFSNVATTPLDVTAQASTDIFPGTIWVADNIGNKVTIFEPSDY